MKKFRGVIWVGALLAFHAVAGIEKDGLRYDTVAPLKAGETGRALLLHSGFLWTGNWELDKPSVVPEIHVFEPSTRKLVGKVVLSHRAQYMYPFGANRVLASGIGYAFDGSGFISRVSVVEKNGSTFGVQTYEFPNKYGVTDTGQQVEPVFVRQYAGNTKRHFFSMFADSALLEAFPNGRYQKLPLTIVNPASLLLIGDTLYAVGLDINNVLAININTYASKLLLPPEPVLPPDAPDIPLLSELISLQNDTTVGALSADYLHLIDQKSQTVTTSLHLAEPQATHIVEVGHCVAVSFELSRKIRFYDLLSGLAEVDAWDLSVLGGSFNMLHAISFDSVNRQIFAKASYPCRFCAVTPNSVTVVQDLARGTLEKCGVK